MYVYIVKPNESTASIAAKFGGTQHELMHANPSLITRYVSNIGKTHLIFKDLYAGQRLVIPYNWVQRGLGINGPAYNNNSVYNGGFVGVSDDPTNDPNVQSGPSADLTCDSGMHKECTNEDCKCVQDNNAIYWILGGAAILLAGAIGVSAYRAYRGMPEPGVVYAPGSGVQPVLPLREPIKQNATVSGWVLTWNPARPNLIDLSDEGKTGWSDQAIRYQDGRIAYDSPERIPVKVRDKVRKMFMKFAGWPDTTLREPDKYDALIEPDSRRIDDDFVSITYKGKKTERFIPDVRIEKDNPRYVLYPMHGFSKSLAVEDINGELIGWIGVEDLGFKDVKEWMKTVDYIA